MPQTKGRVLPRVGATGKFRELQRNREAAPRVPRALCFHSISVPAPDPKRSHQQSLGPLRAQRATPHGMRCPVTGDPSVKGWGGRG